MGKLRYYVTRIRYQFYSKPVSFYRNWKNSSLIEVIELISLIFAILLILAALILFYVIIKNTPNLSKDFSAAGVNNFFVLFSGPIKVLAASFAFFLVWLTSMRMGQTQNQLHISESSYKFTTYNEFKKKFYEEIEYSDLFTELRNVGFITNDHRNTIMLKKTIFDSFFIVKWQQFEPILNHKGKEFLLLLNQNITTLNECVSQRQNYEIVGRIVVRLRNILNSDLSKYFFDLVIECNKKYALSDDKDWLDMSLYWFLSLGLSINEFIDVFYYTDYYSILGFLYKKYFIDRDNQ